MSSGFPSRVRRFFGDFFLLESAEKAIAGRTPAQIEAIRNLENAALARVRIADDLTDPTHAPIAMSLYREAIVCFAAAMVAAAGEEVSLDSPNADAWFSRVRDLAKTGRISALPVGFEEAVETIQQGALLAYDRIPADTLARKRTTLEETVGWARANVEGRTHADLRMTRLYRIGICVLFLLAFAGWRTYNYMEPPNVALHKPVTASSRSPTSTAPGDNGGIVDGNTGGTYGVHTQVEDRPTVTLDLQSDFRLRRIKIYNRGDGSFDEGLPFILELSTNGTDFVEVDRRTTAFSQANPWVYSAGSKKARYVRIRKDTRGYIALAEVEVYGY